MNFFALFRKGKGNIQFMEMLDLLWMYLLANGLIFVIEPRVGSVRTCRYSAQIFTTACLGSGHTLNYQHSLQYVCKKIIPVDFLLEILKGKNILYHPNFFNRSIFVILKNLCILFTTYLCKYSMDF